MYKITGSKRNNFLPRPVACVENLKAVYSKLDVFLEGSMLAESISTN